MRLATMAAVVLAWSSAVMARVPPAADGTPAPIVVAGAEVPVADRIPGGTRVELEIVSMVSSTTSQRDQVVALRLAESIVVDGITLVPAGAEGGGVILDAAPAGGDGRPGKLIVAGRYLLIDGVRVALRGAQFMATGDHATNRVEMWISDGYLIRPYSTNVLSGDDLVIPAGTRITGRLGVTTDATSAGPINDAPPEALDGPIPAGQARVVFFRQNRLEGRLRNYPLRTADVAIGPLRNASFLTYDAPEGIYAFASGNGQETLRFQVEAGAIYYVEWLLADGVLMSRPLLRPSTRAAFEAARPMLTPSTQ